MIAVRKGPRRKWRNMTWVKEKFGLNAGQLECAKITVTLLDEAQTFHHSIVNIVTFLKKKIKWVSLLVLYYRVATLPIYLNNLEKTRNFKKWGIFNILSIWKSQGIRRWKSSTFWLIPYFLFKKKKSPKSLPTPKPANSLQIL